MSDSPANSCLEDISLDELLAHARRNERIARALFEIEVEVMNLNDCASFVDCLVDRVRERFNLEEAWVVFTDIEVNTQIRNVLTRGGALTVVMTEPTVDYMRLTGNARTPLLIDSPQRYSRLVPAEWRSWIGSMAVLPLLLEGRVIGSLVLGSADPARYHPDMESFFLHQLAVKASIGLSGVWAREQLRELATRDPLTGLRNRRDLDAVLHQELSRARRYAKPLTLLFIDCDDFKQVNDDHGHECGDAYLCFLARELQTLLRDDDLVFRFAGDEFVILLPNQTENEAELVGERLTEHFARTPLQFQGKTLSVSFSRGIASNEQPGLSDARSMLRLADQRLYEKKRSRKNTS